MPCYTIRQTPVAFEKVAYKPGHLALLIAALREMGFEIQANLAAGAAVRIWPAGSAPNLRNTILYQDGTFEIPATLKDRFTVDRIREAYARQAVKLHARRNGWLVREISQTEFELVKR